MSMSLHQHACASYSAVQSMIVHRVHIQMARRDIAFIEAQIAAGTIPHKLANSRLEEARARLAKAERSKMWAETRYNRAQRALGLKK